MSHATPNGPAVTAPASQIRDLPVGLDAAGPRSETDSIFTGMPTRTIDEAAGGSKSGVRRSARQLIALLAGAIASGAVLHAARPAAPAVPLFLLATAAIVHLRSSRQADPEAGQQPA